MARKTIEIAYLLEKANYFLEHSDDSQRDMRNGVASLLEVALHKANAYKGFAYLLSEYLPAEEQTDDNVLRPDYDDTRRFYY